MSKSLRTTFKSEFDVYTRFVYERRCPAKECYDCGLITDEEFAPYPEELKATVLKHLSNEEWIVLRRLLKTDWPHKIDYAPLSDELGVCIETSYCIVRRALRSLQKKGFLTYMVHLGMVRFNYAAMLETGRTILRNDPDRLHDLSELAPTA